MACIIKNLRSRNYSDVGSIDGSMSFTDIEICDVHNRILYASIYTVGCPKTHLFLCIKHEFQFLYCLI